MPASNPGHKYASYQPNEAFQDFVRSKRCFIRNHPLHFAKCLIGAQACHVRARGPGGHDERREDGAPDEGNLWNACAVAHDEEHKGWRSFEKKYGIDRRAIAAALWQEFNSRPRIEPAF